MTVRPLYILRDSQAFAEMVTTAKKVFWAGAQTFVEQLLSFNFGLKVCVFFSVGTLPIVVGKGGASYLGRDYSWIRLHNLSRHTQTHTCIHTHTEPSESIHTPWLFHMLLCYRLNLKWIKCHWPTHKTP